MSVYRDIMVAFFYAGLTATHIYWSDKMFQPYLHAFLSNNQHY